MAQSDAHCLTKDWPGKGDMKVHEAIHAVAKNEQIPAQAQLNLFWQKLVFMDVSDSLCLKGYDLTVSR